MVKSTSKESWLSNVEAGSMSFPATLKRMEVMANMRINPQKVGKNMSANIGSEHIIISILWNLYSIITKLQIKE